MPLNLIFLQLKALLHLCSMIQIHCMCSNEDEARTIAHSLVKSHLAACCNILPGISSIYEWQNKLELSQEVLLLIKTVPENYKEIEELILKDHSYECPAIYSTTIESGYDPYLAWIKANSNA